MPFLLFPIFRLFWFSNSYWPKQALIGHKKRFESIWLVDPWSNENSFLLRVYPWYLNSKSQIVHQASYRELSFDFAYANLNYFVAVLFLLTKLPSFVQCARNIESRGKWTVHRKWTFWIWTIWVTPKESRSKAWMWTVWRMKVDGLNEKSRQSV